MFKLLTLLSALAVFGIRGDTPTPGVDRIPKQIVPIISQESEVDYTGKYHYSYESGDGSKADQTGEIKVLDKDHSAESVSGGFEYTGDDGKSYKLTYTADEKGYQPHGDYLPVAPETPPLIARALEYLATAKPPKEEKIQ